MKRYTRRTDHDAEDRIWRAAFLGDDCPQDFNPFVYFDYEWALRDARGLEALSAAARETWPRLRDEVMREWANRNRKGLPPGAALEAR